MQRLGVMLKTFLSNKAPLIEKKARARLERLSSWSDRPREGGVERLIEDRKLSNSGSTAPPSAEHPGGERDT
jgi:hypothetical protein